jgi:ADP-heptose:LPS heptosyltransferase
MTLNLLPALRAARPQHAIHYFCHPAIGAALAGLLRAAGVDVVEDCATFAARQGEFALAFNLVGYPLAEGYPEKPMRRHLLQYFAQELGLAVDELPSLTLPRPPRPAALPLRYATLQTHAGWSVYKNWPIEGWERVLSACPEIPIYQIGLVGAPQVAGARQDFVGAPLADAIALVANANLHLGIDSFANHLTHYRWAGASGATPGHVPAVILWGSTQASAAGYPHNINISLGLPCQPCFREDPARSAMPRGVCTNPPGQTYAQPRHACMAGIRPDDVIAAARRLWAHVS